MAEPRVGRGPSRISRPGLVLIVSNIAHLNQAGDWPEPQIKWSGRDVASLIS